MAEAKIKLTAQEAFDTVARHLLDQGHAATTKDDEGFLICRYRAANGDRCAVGCLIPDGLYKPGFEGSSVKGLPAIFSKSLIALLARLQAIHDADNPNDSGYARKATGEPAFDVQLLKARLAEVAHNFELSTSVLEEAR
jgi:hypothetical protein